jgi:replicative DNA helicase
MSTAEAQVPPQNLEAEESVLGAMMVSEAAIASVILDVHLTDEDFYRERHRIIFRAIRSLSERGEPVDALTVSEHLAQRGELEEAGGKEFVSSLASTVPVPGNAAHYAKIVKANSMLRRLLTASQRIQKSVHEREAEPRDLVERAERMLFEVAHDTSAQDFVSITSILERETTRLEELSEGRREMTGTPSGFHDLDALTGGFQPGNLIIFAARPAMGKCLVGSTLVHDPVSGTRRRLDDLYRAAFEGEDLWVTSLGPDMKLRPAQASAVARNGRKPTFRLTTRLGRSLQATANHPLLTRSGWKPLGQLVPGERIAVPRRLPLADPRELPAGAAVAAVKAREGEPAPAGALAPSAAERVATALLEPAPAESEPEHQDADIFWDEIVSIEPAGVEETYDLQVPGDESFVADDIVVHNSALVANIADHVAVDKGQPVAFFSLEMSETELAHRFLACRARIPGDKLRKGQIKDLWPKVLRASNQLENAPIWIDTSSDLSVLELRSKARRLYSREGGLGLIIVDYMQLMRPDDPRANRVEQVGQISRGLKLLAGELGVPVLGLSQLSRAPELRPDKRPILSDLRESGNLEQDADLVVFIFREEYYEQDPDEEIRGKAELILAKHRNGPIGTVELAFQSAYPRFMNLARTDRQAPPPDEQAAPAEDPFGIEEDEF